MRHRVLIAGLASACSMWAVTEPVASAHGAAPAVLDVLAEAAPGRPSLLALSQGAAVLQPSGAFAFVCPSAWGGQAAVLAAGDHRAGAVLAAVSGGGLFTQRAGDTCGLHRVALGTETAAVDVVAHADGFLALGRDAQTTRAFAVDDASGVAVLWDERTPPCALEGLVSDDDTRRVWGACGGSMARLVPLDGVSSPLPVALPFFADRLEPRRATAEAVWLRASTQRGAYLIEQTLPLDPSSELPAAPTAIGPFQTLLGPVLVDATARAVVAVVGDGRLWIRREGVWAEGAEASFTCLSQVGRTLYGCRQARVVRLETDGAALVEKEVVFSLSMLGPPIEPCLAASDAANCAGDWSHFGAEAGLLGSSPATVPDGARGEAPALSAGSAPVTSSAGCAWASRPMSSCPCGWATLAFLALARAHSRRGRTAV